MDPVDELNSICCPITLSPMSDPVILTSDGHTYERSAITNWFKNNSTSPMSGEVIGENCMLIPNHALRNAIAEFRERAGSKDGGDEGYIKAGRLGPTKVHIKGSGESKHDNGREESKTTSKPERGRKGSWFGGWNSTSDDFTNTTDTYSENMGKGELSDIARGELGGREAVGTFALMEKKKRILEMEQTRNSADSKPSADTSNTDDAKGMGVAYGEALKGSEANLSDRRFLSLRRTRDHIIVCGMPLTSTSSVGTSGIFQHIQPYPDRISVDGDMNVTGCGSKVLSAGGAKEFPGLLATAGMGRDVQLWIHRPLEDTGVVKKEKKEGRFKLSNWIRRNTDEHLNAAGTGGFWENFANLKGSKDWLNDVKFSDDASLVLAGGRAGSIHLWRSPQMGPLAGEWENVSNVQKAHSGGEFNAGVVKSVALHPGRTRAYSGGMDWDLKAWDIDGREEGLGGGRVMGNGGNKHSAPINDIAISEMNGLLATAGDDGRVLVWDERCKEGEDCITKLQVSEKPCSGCVFQPYGIGGGGNWIVTSDEEGCIKVWDLRKWELSRVIYDSRKVHGSGDSYGSSGRWEGGNKVDLFKDVQISTEGWVCAVTEPGHLYSWDPSKNWEMNRQPTRVKATCLTISRVLA